MGENCQILSETIRMVDDDDLCRINWSIGEINGRR